MTPRDIAADHVVTMRQNGQSLESMALDAQHALAAIGCNARLSALMNHERIVTAFADAYTLSGCGSKQDQETIQPMKNRIN